MNIKLTPQLKLLIHKSLEKGQLFEQYNAEYLSNPDDLELKEKRSKIIDEANEAISAVYNYFKSHAQDF